MSANSASRPALVLDVYVGFPSYGGNGGIASEVPDIRNWWAETLLKMKSDPRVGTVTAETISDTPVTMVRNRFVANARKAGAHLLLMVDSDQNPLIWQNDPEKKQKPFWDVAFDEIYQHYGKGPLVIGAPYCGPPGADELVYVFYWENDGNHGGDRKIKLEMYPRAIAAQMRGVQEVGALPTGLILYDLRAFDLIEPSPLPREQVIDDLLEGKITKVQALAALEPGWFKYEWRSNQATEKASTEDVQNTRDISLAGMDKLGYNPLRCAWDCWVGHWKPWCVGKPDYYGVRDIAATFRRSVLEDRDKQVEAVDLGEVPAALAVKVQVAGGKAEPTAQQADIPANSQQWQLNFDKLYEIASRVKTPNAHVQAIVTLARIARKRFSNKDQFRHPRYLEVGCWIGETAKQVAREIEFVTLIDPLTGNPNDITSGIVKEVGGPEVMSSLLRMNYISMWGFNCWYGKVTEIKQQFRLIDSSGLGTFELIFLDANHDYEEVLADIQAAIPLLSCTGYLAIHDFATHQFPGVEKAVVEVMNMHHDLIARVFHFDQNGGIFVFARPAVGAPKGESEYTRFGKTYEEWRDSDDRSVHVSLDG